MTRNRKLSVVAATVSIVGGASLAPLALADPTGMDVIERSIDALGGAEAIASVKSFHVTGTYAIPAAGAEGTIEMHYASSGKARFTVSFPGFGELRRGFDGTTAWSIDPQQGARILEGDERDALIKQVKRGFGLLPTAELFQSASLIESGEFDGQASHSVEVVGKDGETWTEIFSQETGLMIARKEAYPSIQGSLDITYRPSDYQQAGPVLMPSRWENDAGVQQWTAVYQEFHFDEVDESVFELPAEIQAIQN